MKIVLAALVVGLLLACGSPTDPSPSMGGGKKKTHQCCLGGLKSSLRQQRLHPDARIFDAPQPVVR